MRILLADDHSVVRCGLKQILAGKEPSVPRPDQGAN